MHLRVGIALRLRPSVVFASIDRTSSFVLRYTVRPSSTAFTFIQSLTFGGCQPYSSVHWIPVSGRLHSEFFEIEICDRPKPRRVAFTSSSFSSNTRLPCPFFDIFHSRGHVHRVVRVSLIRSLYWFSFRSWSIGHTLRTDFSHSKSLLNLKVSYSSLPSTAPEESNQLVQAARLPRSFMI